METTTGRTLGRSEQMTWTRMYRVEADYLPFRHWLIKAESESEARMALVAQIGVPYEETSAKLTLETNL